MLNRPGQDGSGTVSYEYDANGNQIKKTEGGKVTQFGYDSDNRLVQVKDGSGNLIARYGYDPQNRRIWKEQYRDRVGNALSQAKRTYFLYNEEGLIAEATQAITLTAEGSVTATAAPAISTQYGPKPESEFTTGTLFIKTKNSNGEDTFAYYQHNHLMTPMQAVDKTGRVLWAGSYNPFGEASVITPNATQERPTINSNLRLPGQYLDDETGLHYNYFRTYDPRTGRYTQADPIGLDGGWNRFGYVSGNPLNYTDPSGLSAASDFASGAASYFTGLYGTARYAARRAGALGSYQRCRAEAEGAIAMDAIELVLNNPGVAADLAKDYALRHPGKIAGRQGVTLAVNYGLSRAGPVGTGLGVALTIAAMNGSIRNAVESGANAQGALEAVLGGELGSVPGNPGRVFDECTCRR